MLQLLLSSDSLADGHVRLEIFNEGFEAVQLPSAHVGFNRGGVIDGDYFEFNQRVQYVGHDLARTLDPAASLLVEPNYSHAITVIDLSKHYLLPERRPLRVRYNHAGHVSNAVTI